MQHSAALTMRLRPRPSLDGNTANESRANRQGSRSTRSAILGDISNRNPVEDSRITKNADKSRSNRNRSVCMDESSQQQASKPRRLSARLKQLRERNEEQENNHDNIIQQKAATTLNTKTNHQSAKGSALKKRNGKRRRTSEAIKSTTSTRSKKAKTKKLELVELKEYIREDEDRYLMHPDFRLKRHKKKSYDVIQGMSKHDRENEDDVLQASPYVSELLQHHYSLEGLTRPRPYMTEQTDINAKMRAILVDWLIEVHMKFRLVPETLYLCINIIDRYCMKVKVRRAKLQLVGVTALLIACKYEEIYPPEVRDCVYITDSAYQREEVLNMEQDIVHKLGFRMTVPTAYSFLQRYLKLLNAPSLIKHAASYYTERTLQEHDMLRYKPSLICAAAVVLAFNNPDTQDEILDLSILYDGDEYPLMPLLLLEYTGFRREDLLDCGAKIAVKVSEEPITASRRQLVAVKRKYDNKKYSNVSTKLRLPSATEDEL